VPPTPATNVLLVSTGAVWRYLDTGENAGAGWRSIAFNDAGWLAGPAELGYGEADEATVVRSNGVSGRIVTTYFRHAFQLAAPETVADLTVNLQRDDGGIVYLNGAEVFRSNLTNAAVDYLTLAVLASDDGQSWITTNLAATLLQPGTNVVTVEIHQESATSSDVSFDLSLEAAPRPVLQWLRFGGDYVLAWEGAGYVLEQTEQLGPAAAWSAIPASSPVPVAVAGPQRYFRLRKN
jgi:hypothetical protein